MPVVSGGSTGRAGVPPTRNVQVTGPVGVADASPDARPDAAVPDAEDEDDEDDEEYEFDL